MSSRSGWKQLPLEEEERLRGQQPGHVACTVKVGRMIAYNKSQYRKVCGDLSGQQINIRSGYVQSGRGFNQLNRPAVSSLVIQWQSRNSTFLRLQQITF
jgi:hypothetical protein